MIPCNYFDSTFTVNNFQQCENIRISVIEHPTGIDPFDRRSSKKLSKVFHLFFFFLFVLFIVVRWRCILTVQPFTFNWKYRKLLLLTDNGYKNQFTGIDQVTHKFGFGFFYFIFFWCPLKLVFVIYCEPFARQRNERILTQWWSRFSDNSRKFA